MGLFSRKSAVAARSTETEHVVVDSELLARVDRLISAFERQAMTGGTRDAMDEAVIAINRAGTRPEEPAWAYSERDYMIRLADQAAAGVRAGHVRMWTWLAAVAEGAAERGEDRLAVRCVHFMAWWLLAQTPRMTPAAEMAMRLPAGVPDEPAGRLLTVGLQVTSHLPPAELLIDDAPSHENTVRMADALRAFAFLSRGRTAHLAPDVASMPSHVLGE